MAGKFELKTAKNGKYHFNLLAGNGQVILSSQMYETKAAAVIGINSVIKNSTDEALFEIKIANNGEFFFVLKAGNGKIIGQSEQYKTRQAVQNGIESVGKNAPAAETVGV